MSINPETIFSGKPFRLLTPAEIKARDQQHFRDLLADMVFDHRDETPDEIKRYYPSEWANLEAAYLEISDELADALDRFISQRADFADLYRKHDTAEIGHRIAKAWSDYISPRLLELVRVKFEEQAIRTGEGQQASALGYED